MKLKESVIGGLDRILSAYQASALLGIPADDLLPYYSAQDAMSLRNLLKRICRSNPVYHFPIIGETTYTLKGVMSAIGKGRSWTLEFLERHNVRNWCFGVHYLHSKSDVDLAWQKESPFWSEWVSILQVFCLYGLDLQEVIRNVAAGRIRVRQGQREQLVSLKDVKRLWKAQGE